MGKLLAAALLILLASPGPALAGDGEIIDLTLKDIQADYVAYSEKYAAMPFEEKVDLRILDVPAYRGKKIRVTVTVWKMMRSMGGVPLALVREPMGEELGRRNLGLYLSEADIREMEITDFGEQSFDFFFDGRDMRDLSKVMEAMLARRPVTITGTLYGLDNTDIWIKNCVVE